MSSRASAVGSEPVPRPPKSPDAEGSRVGRNFTALAGGQLITWTTTLLWTIVVPRALGPTGMGLIVTALAVTGVFSILLGLGTRNYLVREIVIEPAAASRLVGTGLVLRLVLAPLFALAIVVYAQFADYGRDGTLVLYLAAVAAILTLLAEPMQAGFQALERMKYLAYSDVINKSSQGLVGVVLVLLGFRAIGLTASSIVVAAIVVGLDAYWLNAFFRIHLRTTVGQLAEMARQSVAYWAFGVFFMIYLWIDSMMLSLMTKPEVVGWYGVPTKLFQTLMFLPVLLSTAWLPRLVTAFGSGVESLRAEARRPLEFVVVLSAPICAATTILAGPVIDLLYGSRYEESVPVLVILGLCIPPMYVNIMLNQVLVAAKRQVVWTWVMVGATIVNPLINLVLIPATQSRYDNGAIGAAVSLLVTEALIVTAGFVMVGYHVFDRKAARRCLLAVAASVAMWAVAYALRPLGTLASLAAGALTFIALASAFRLVTNEEIAFVRRNVSKVIRRGR